MTSKLNRESILRMAQGALEERADKAMAEAIDNILDPNTKATAKRSITLNIEMKPDEERSRIEVSVSVKTKLAALNPVPTTLAIVADGNGEMVVAEMVPQVPGQMSMAGEVQEEPKILRLLEAQGQ